KEERYQEIIQSSLINNGHIDICGTEEGKAMHKYFHYLDAKIKMMKEMNNCVHTVTVSNEGFKTRFLPSFIPSFSTCVFCGGSDNLAEQLALTS
ncbi:16241_t:CDS:2, partial [Rhizophagus irregularis]